MLFRYRWCPDNQVNFFRDQIRLFLKMDLNSFPDKLVGKRGGGFIIPCYIDPIPFKIPGQGAHPDAADTQEVNRFELVKIHRVWVSCVLA